MGLGAVYLGQKSWTDYISNHACLLEFEKAIEQGASVDVSLLAHGSMQLALNQNDYSIALEAGLGALGAPVARTAVANSCNEL